MLNGKNDKSHKNNAMQPTRKFIDAVSVCWWCCHRIGGEDNWITNSRLKLIWQNLGVISISMTWNAKCVHFTESNSPSELNKKIFAVWYWIKCELIFCGWRKFQSLNSWLCDNNQYTNYPFVVHILKQWFTLFVRGISSYYCATNQPQWSLHYYLHINQKSNRIIFALIHSSECIDCWWSAQTVEDICRMNERNLCIASFWDAF